MKKFLLLMLSIITMMSNTVAFGEVYVENDKLSAPNIEAQSAILMDMNSGRVIYSKNPDEQLYPASTTKILTGIMALELANMQDVVTADLASLAPITNEDSHMGILIGEHLTMEQLINGMLIYSANDAANVIATHISGTSEHFVELMNQKAQELGAINTHFTNTYGIQDEDHYTTASDLAIISRYAMQNPQFREIVGRKVYNIPATNKYTTERILPSTNLFLSTFRSDKYYYPAVNGIKTGHTNSAGFCLVSSAKVENTELLCVVLKANSQEMCYSNSRALFDYGFKNYQYRALATAGEVISDSKVYEAKDDERVAFTVTEDVSALLPKDAELSEIVETVIDLPEKIKAPIKKGDVIGKVSYNYKTQMIGYSDLVATNDVERNNLLFVFHLIVGILVSPFFLIPAIGVVVILVLRQINIAKQERRKRLRRLHGKSSKAQIRPGTKRPVNTRYEEPSRKRGPKSPRK